MPRVKGYVDGRTPRVSITVHGTESARHVDAIVDTGFDGFILLPEEFAIPVGIPRYGSVRLEVRLADNSVLDNWMGIAAVSLGAETQDGLIIVVPQGEVLIGMQFLDYFSKTLIVDSSNVILTDEIGPDLLVGM